MKALLLGLFVFGLISTRKRSRRVGEIFVDAKGHKKLQVKQDKAVLFVSVDPHINQALH